MPVTNIVTSAEVRTLAASETGFDANMIKPQMIWEAQKHHLKSVLGADLYVDVLLFPANYTALISGTDYTYSGKNKYFEGIKRFVAYATMYEAIPFIYTALGASGFSIKNVDSATASSESSVDGLRNKYYMLMQGCIDDIQEYINDNIASYPLYSNETKGRVNGGVYCPNKTVKRMSNMGMGASYYDFEKQ